MSYPRLEKLDIYVIPVGDMFDVDTERLCIVYAPLAGKSLLVDKKVLDELELILDGDMSSPKASVLFELCRKADLPFLKMHDDPEHLHQIDILTNYTCNFKCVYCYSAKGRSSKEIKWDTLKPLLDYLFLSDKQQTRPYIIHFSGGGEPLMSFALIQQAVEYIESVAGDYKYQLGVVTNGSLLTEDKALYLKNHNIEIALSFEILKDLQNQERGQYDKVASNIDMLQDMKVPFGIRTTFTQDSVGRMIEMVDELHSRFPKIKNVVFDTVLSPELFPTPQSLDNYYKNYINQYYKAKLYAKTFGIQIDSIAIETLSMLRDRTCEGKIVLTPMGTISACSRVSSPEETFYNDSIYGEIKEGKIVFDKVRFKAIMDENNIYTQPLCSNCFAKWNCGGGCRLFYQSFSPEFIKPKCDFAREGLRIQLFNSICNNYERATGQNLIEAIHSKILSREI